MGSDGPGTVAPSSRSVGGSPRRDQVLILIPMAGNESRTGAEHGQATAVRRKERVRHPRLYRVLLHNDDYTTMEFVVTLLLNVFHRTETEAVQIMLHVHRRGLGVAGVYPREVAESRVDKVARLAREAEFPLRCTMEPSG